MVDIFVSPAQTHFRVHKKLLCTKSEYFKKMFSGDFKEVIESAVRMPEDDADAFDLFVQWLYSGRLEYPDMALNTSTSGPMWNRFNLHCFAEKICLPDLMDYTMSSIMSACARGDKSPSLAVIGMVYGSTTHGSKLRQFFAHTVHFMIRNGGDLGPWPSSKLAQVMTDHEDLTLGVLQLLRNNSGPPSSPGQYQKCMFHVHGKEHACKYKHDTP